MHQSPDEKICFRIEKGRKEDLDAIEAIQKKSFSEIISRKLWEREIELSVSRILVVRIMNGESDDASNNDPYNDLPRHKSLAGYIDFWVTHDEAQIISFAVDPAYRGKGLGNQLLQSMLKHCVLEGVREVVLDVRESNHTAIHIYHRLGFKNVASRKSYYTDNQENAITMQMCLKSDKQSI